MILVAASAVGLALGRTILGDALSLPSSPMWVARPVTYVLLPLTLAVPLLRLRGEWPAFRPALREPGMVACSAVAVVVTIQAFAWAIYSARTEPRFATDTLARFWRVSSGSPGPAVAACWLALAFGSHWRPRRCWTDRLGRSLGALWLLTLVCDWRFGRWTFNLIERLVTRS